MAVDLDMGVDLGMEVGLDNMVDLAVLDIEVAGLDSLEVGPGRELGLDRQVVLVGSCTVADLR